MQTIPNVYVKRRCSYLLYGKDCSIPGCLVSKLRHSASLGQTLPSLQSSVIMPQQRRHQKADDPYKGWIVHFLTHLVLRSGLTCEVCACDQDIFDRVGAARNVDHCQRRRNIRIQRGTYNANPRRRDEKTHCRPSPSINSNSHVRHLLAANNSESCRGIGRFAKGHDKTHRLFWCAASFRDPPISCADTRCCSPSYQMY